VDIDKTTYEALKAHLETLVTENKKNKMQKVLDKRTEHVCIVLEDLYQPHNASACLRSCECFGIQHIHTIENRNGFAPSETVTMGSNKWLDIHRWKNPDGKNTQRCLQDLKAKGYTIAATAFNKKTIPLNNLPLEKPIALVFGTEETGITEDVEKEADVFVKIPMYGFTQSFNISVSVALCLYDISTRLHNGDIDWKLPPESREKHYFEWLQRTIRHPELQIERFLQEYKKS